MAVSGSAIVVDDDPAIRRLVRQVLAQAGYTVIEAANGRDALDQLGRGSAAVLVTDLVMPDMDGIELILSVRRRGLALKIIAMSGEGGDLYLRLATQLGADFMLAKPFSIDELRKALNGVSFAIPNWNGRLSQTAGQ